MHLPGSGQWVAVPAMPSELKQLVRTLSLAADPTPRTCIEDFLVEACRATAEQARATVDAMVDVGIVEIVSQTSDTADETWAAHGWSEALWFHAHMAQVERLDYSTVEGQRQDIALMRSYVADGSMPIGDDRLNEPIAPTVEPARGGRGAAAALEARIGANQPPALACDELTRLMHLAFAWTGVLSLPISGRHPLRTSPSGGARHPTDPLVVVTDVAGLHPGCYGFDASSGQLEPAACAADPEALLQDVIIRIPHWLGFQPRAAIVFTTTFDRSMARYRESHSYKVVHHDVGHLMETVALLCAAADRPTLRLYSLDEAAVEAALGLARLETSATSAIVVG